MRYLWILSLFCMLAYSNEAQQVKNMEEALFSLSNQYDDAKKLCETDNTRFSKACTEVLVLGQKIVSKTATYHKLVARLKLQTERNISVVQKEKNILENIRDRCLFRLDREACTLMNKNIYKIKKVTEAYEMLGEQKRCQKGSFESCSLYAEYLLKHRKFKDAIKYSENACDKKNYEACSVLGLAYRGLKQIDTSLFYLTLACEHKVGKACHVVGEYYEFIGKDKAKADTFYRVGCNEFFLDACLKSHTVPSALDNAEALNRQLKAHQKRETIANEKLEKMYPICQKGDNEVCQKYLELSNQKFADKAPEWQGLAHKLQCERGHLDACWEYARSIPYDQTTKIIMIYKEACDKGHNRSCLYLAGKYKSNKVKEKIVPAYQHACKNGSSSACYELGDYLYKSDDKKQAKAYYQKSCIQNHWTGCKRFVDLIKE